MNDKPTRPVATDPTLLDALALERLRELDPDGSRGVVARVFETYQKSLQRQLGAAASARDRGDAAAVADIAHMLKSSSASVGALVFAACCVDLERAIRSGAAVDLAAEVENLLTEGERALQAVRAMLHP